MRLFPQVRETWQTYELELVPYQNKCRLIRGWDELFGKCAEHVASLSAMKLSPYYKVFEDEAAAWEEKLNRVSLLFDVWIDVQRQWVYLEGIFSGSADIKNLLPTETSRFQSINAEFLAVMKKVAKAPAVMEVVAIAGVQRSLERLADLLSKIQKALGEYLERERAAFARFYFVGDEDLLDIIGNSKDVLKIQKHFKKMFAGLAALLLRMETGADGNAVPVAITGIASREGEEVIFASPISLKDGLKINEWLGALEKQMRLTLAGLLGNAVADKADFFPTDAAAAAAAIDGQAYLSWVSTYPAQLVVLASQVLWSEATERALGHADAAAVTAGLQTVLARLQSTLTVLADTVLKDLPPIQRRKCEHLITELVHQRDVVRALLRANVTSARSFEWLYQMRFYYNAKGDDPLTRLSIRMANAAFDYGYEYLGLTDKLVQTPLTDRCYLTLTQALELRLGGSPFGPAGTGKTESVKVKLEGRCVGSIKRREYKETGGRVRREYKETGGPLSPDRLGKPGAHPAHFSVSCFPCFPCFPCFSSFSFAHSGARRSARPLCSGVLLRRDLRLSSDGPHLRRLVPSRRMGLCTCACVCA